MAVASITLDGTSKGIKGDVLPGWTVQEDATSVDILDTSGSTGNVSASFSSIPESASPPTPNSAPVPSSSFLLDQSASFDHPTLGSIQGYITDQDSAEGVVDVDMSTVLDFLNQDVDAPTFIDGSPFYSFPTSTGTIYDMLVDAQGYIWVAPNGPIAYKYDRWGQNVDQANFGSVSLRKLGIDSSGNLYGMSALAVTKWDATTRTASTLISSGQTIYDMDVNVATSMIYLLTTDTTAASAVKKYNLSGTLQTKWGTNNNTLTTPTNGSFANLQGIGVDKSGTFVYVASGTNTTFGGYSSDIQQFSNTGTFQNTNNFGLNTDFNDIRMKPSVDINGAFIMLTISAAGIGRGINPSNGSIINRTYTMPRSNLNNPPYGQMAIASDPNGFGIYVSDNDKVVRLAGGKLSPYQALECYLGMAGFGVKRVGAVIYSNLTTTQLNTFDGGYFPAWSGNLWAQLKQLAARTRFYMTTYSNKVVVTSLTGTLPRIDISNRLPGASKKVETASGRVVEVTNLNTTSAIGSNTKLYNSAPGDSVISADLNEINTTTIRSNSYPVAIDPILNVQGTTWNPSGSIYMVTDSSNPPLLLSAGQFVRAGGSVTASASATLGSIDVTMTGPKIPIAGFTGPFSLAYAVGTQKIPALSISGNGVIVNPEVITMGTGANAAITSQDNTQSIVSPFITSGSIAYDTAQPACVRLGQGDMTLTLRIPLNASHTFGTIAGSIFLYHRTKWRVASAQISEGVISITAKRFTTVADVTPNNPTMTVAQMDTLWSGYRYQDRFLSPGIVAQ